MQTKITGGERMIRTVIAEAVEDTLRDIAGETV